jgi:hypothetical protein
VKYLLSKPEVHVNYEDPYGGTALEDAIRHKHQVVQELLRKAGGRLGKMDVNRRLCEAGTANDLAAAAVPEDGVVPTPRNRRAAGLTGFGGLGADGTEVALEHGSKTQMASRIVDAIAAFLRGSDR